MVDKQHGTGRLAVLGVVHRHEQRALAAVADAAQQGAVVRAAAHEDGGVERAGHRGEVHHRSGQRDADAAVVADAVLEAVVHLEHLDLVAAVLLEKQVEDALLGRIVAGFVQRERAEIAGADDVDIRVEGVADPLPHEQRQALVVDLESGLVLQIEQDLPAVVEPASVDEDHGFLRHGGSLLILLDPRTRLKGRDDAPSRAARPLTFGEMLCDRQSAREI